MTTTIELKPAFMWDCEECGRENFARAIVPEMSEAERQELRDEHGIEPDELGEMLVMPEFVTCTSCGTEFQSKHWGEDVEL